ncbi:sugar phosphate isomerase/epimerase family protein [Jeotgalibacillus soli]|uniref:Xylose isomerase-like TIM barrel domain-containing protein n=1 Tax=Jeotgalibacillus soli TaxID=889306 RepID=A0A0C2VZQ6_9BACL|nr:sugar phosphate isomerase/epimerase family protein [Jeotgalibacillus soli]KIL49856.1 hypothetical protein KP78_13240 [Jeotgalibacillus soli]
MKTSISMYSMNGLVKKEQWTAVDFAHFLIKHEVQGAELLDFYSDGKNDELLEAKKWLNEAGIAVSAYDVSNDFVQSDASERRKEEEKVLRAIETARMLETSIVRVFCGDVKEGITFDQGRSWIVEGLSRCAEEASQAGIRLAIENHGLLAGKSEQVRSIIEEVQSPFVGSTFDTGNFLLVGGDPLASLEELMPHIFHVHFKDFRKKLPEEQLKGFRSLSGEEWIGEVAGDGLVPAQSIVHRLSEARYNGFLSVEYEGYAEPEVANIETIKRLERWIGEVNHG